MDYLDLLSIKGMDVVSLLSPLFSFPSVVLLLLQSSYPSIFDGLYQKVTHNSHLGVVFAKSLDFPLRFPSSIMHS